MNTHYVLIGIRKIASAKTMRIAFAWILGLLSGFLVMRFVNTEIALQMFHYPRGSLLSLLLVLSLPFLISDIIFKFFNFNFILPVIFLKAFSYSFCYKVITYQFGNASWLVNALLFLSDSLAQLVLIHYWYKASYDCKISIQYRICTYLTLAIIALLDYFIISPFLAMLLNY